jgi:hypothetical protein
MNRVNKNGIIKRRKQKNFAQIQNQALQSLTVIRAIGVLAHLMSMPDNWVIRKTHLYSKFGRGPVSSGIAVLEELGHWVQLSSRDGGENIHLYHLSDVVFTELEVQEMILEVEKAGFKVKHISELFRHLLLPQIEEPLDPFSTVDFQQLNFSSPFSTVENQQLLKKEEQRKREQIPIDQIHIVNSQDTHDPMIHPDEFIKAITLACHELYVEYAPGRWSKRSWQPLTETFIKETIETNRYKNIPGDQIRAYAEASIRKMAFFHDKKHQKIPMEVIIPTHLVSFSEWLNAD